MITEALPVNIDGDEWRSAKLSTHQSTTSRAMSAEDTWERVQPILGDYGITRVANVTGLDTVGIPVFTALKPMGRSLSSGSGKGTTDMAARVGAAMEAIEQTVWEAQPLGDIVASEAQLAAADQLFISTQRLARLRDNLLSVDRPLHWTAGWDIVSQREILVPSLAACIPDSYRGVWGGTQISTNGLASGNTVLEAVTSGLLEVIERDAVSYHTTTRRTVDLGTVTDPLANELLARIATAGLHAELVDFTVDTAVPTYGVTLTDRDHSSVGSFSGYGSSLSSRVALVRALTEAAQVRTLVVAGSRDDIFDMERRAWSLVGSRRHTLNADSDNRFIDSDDGTDSFEGDIHAVLGKLADIGITQVVVIRHTSSSDPVQVVRVIVPDLLASMMRGTETFPHLRPGGGRR